MLTIEVDDRLVLDALRQVAGRLGDPAPALKAIGETLAESTRRRFETSTGPDGQRWPSNSPVTILQYLGAYKGSYTKTSKISANGSGRAISKRPLIGETKSLSSTIDWTVSGDSVLIGSPMVYAAVQQFGAKARQFGSAPWGDIPARPFLGVSDDDRRAILDLFSDFLLP
mgnify:CR=1 FL=1